MGTRIDLSTFASLSVPNISPAAFSASGMPSEKKTMRSPGAGGEGELFVLGVRE